MLAELARTDSHNHRPVAGDSELGEAIKVLARAHQSLIWTRQRQLNQLRSTLREFYPAALEAFDELGSLDALAVLAVASTPTLGRRPVAFEDRVGVASRWPPTSRRGTRRSRSRPRCAPTSSKPHRSSRTRWAPPSPRSSRSPSSSLAQIARLETELAEHFEQHPDAKIIRSLPGLGMILGARVLAEFGDDPNRYADAKCRKNYAGTSPITRASGKHRVVLARYARNKRLADACYLWAFAALTASPGARTFYDQRRAAGDTHNRPYAPSATGSSASSTAASPTAPSTTNTPPGDTAPNSPLDTYDPWDV